MLLEPPIDTDADEPSVDGSAFRREHALRDEELAIVAVSRLARGLKLEGLEMAIDAMAALDGVPARLIIVGGGAESDRLAARARELNERVGRHAVVLAGPTTDPRPAYAAADVVLGMGGSILRGMAFGKPSVVLGEAGFWRLVSPETVDLFLHEGFYGLGEGADPSGLAGCLRELALDGGRRRELGGFARKLVCDRFSLPMAANGLELFYRRVLEDPPLPHIVEVAKVAAWVAGIKTKQRLARVLG
jgi:glycosyltransferase involved in cell wall biosynthesis